LQSDSRPFGNRRDTKCSCLHGKNRRLSESGLDFVFALTRREMKDCIVTAIQLCQKQTSQNIAAAESLMQSAQSETTRKHMVDSQLRTNGITTAWIVKAMGELPRENFLPSGKEAFAYLDRSVPLGNGRMLNPPLATAEMLQIAEVSESDNVLLIGAGTGYLAALLSGRVKKLVAVESDAELAAAARAIVSGLDVVEGELSQGSKKDAPYSLIIIDGAIEQLPAAIEGQLANRGRIVTGLAEGPVRRLAIGTNHGGHVALRAFADIEVAALPGFERAREFVF
jgi:protein-L-isoaspartate(D-aspartate) O-methyltransferase